MSQRIKPIVQLALPIILSMLSQSVMNIVDTLLVAPLGDVAIAAVGYGSSANFVGLALIAGFSTTTQAQIARLKGAQSAHHCQLLFEQMSYLCGLAVFPLALLLLVSAPLWLTLLTPYTDSIHHASVDYFQLRVLALPAAAMQLVCRGYWNGDSQPNTFLLTLVSMQIVNVLFSMLFIYGGGGIPAMGVSGAALGTCIALYLGAFINHRYIITRFRRTTVSINFSILWQLFKKILPDSMQQLTFATGTLLLFVIVAQLGVAQMAVIHVILNISLVLVLPALGFGMAANTLVNHRLGANKFAQAWLTGNQVLHLTTMILIVLSIPMLLMPKLILALFLEQSELIEMAVTPLRVTIIAIILDVPALVFTQVLLGCGAKQVVLLVRFASQWLIFLPLCGLGVLFKLPLALLWYAFLVQKIVSGLTCYYIWQQRRWANINKP